MKPLPAAAKSTLDGLAGAPGGSPAGRNAYPVKDLVIDLIAANEGPIPVSLLVETGVRFGYSEGSVRVCLSRMVASGTLGVTEGESRTSLYGFTPAADRFNRRIRAQVYTNQREEPWSGKWRMVAFSCAASRRDARQRFLYVLEGQRFRSLHRGLWIRPDNVDLDLDGAVAELRRVATVDVMSGVPDAASDLEKRALDLWGIEKLAAHFQRHMRRLDQSRARIRGLSGEQALVESLSTAARSFRLLARDPLLPLEILPSDWPGELFRQMLVDYTDLACDVWADVAQARPARPLRARPARLAAGANAGTNGP